VESQQHCSACVSDPPHTEAKKGLIWTFDTRSDFERTQRYIERKKFETTLPAKIDVAVAEAAVVIDREIERQKPQPIYTEQPVNDELQTGDSRDLGGEMRIQSPVKPAFDQ
jgi:hypothetical protein